MTTTRTRDNWQELLKAAVNQPDLILKAYSNFHGYSLNNQILAVVQCSQRGIEPGPINTYPGWQKLGRNVKKGEKALMLLAPLSRSRTSDQGEREQFMSGFQMKPRWFVFAQTDGEPYELPPLPEWSKDRALTALNITEQPFMHTDGNMQGYAQKREIGNQPGCSIASQNLVSRTGPHRARAYG